MYCSQVVKLKTSSVQKLVTFPSFYFIKKVLLFYSIVYIRCHSSPVTLQPVSASCEVLLCKTTIPFHCQRPLRKKAQEKQSNQVKMQVYKVPQCHKISCDCYNVHCTWGLYFSAFNINKVYN